VIDCPGLQAGGPLYESAAECHDQLGDTADLYSTVDIADDLEDVRQALGYDRIDLFGGSYAGNDMITYAHRYTDRVRSVVRSSPAIVVGTDPFYPYAPEAMPGVVAAVCGRSPACAAANRKPARSFAQLANQLRRHPVTGVGVDSAGFTHDITHDITVTENLLSNFIMYFNGAHFTGPGEITPAAAALGRGDPVPLLRLAADVDPANGFAFAAGVQQRPLVGAVVRRRRAAVRQDRVPCGARGPVRRGLCRRASPLRRHLERSLGRRRPRRAVLVGLRA
jgi:pimeloyl-ACP methyl ester carboxylesterase